MKIKPQKISSLIEQLEQLRAACEEKVATSQDQIDAVCETYRESARNLLHYQAFREFDVRSVQKQLRNLSLSRLANAEGHVMASLHNTLFILHRLIAEKPPKARRSGYSVKKANRLLASHTKALLGYRSKGRRVRIMVTQPTEAAYNYPLVEQMVRDGMNCARVNCAHDDPSVWKRIIDNVRKAAQANGRNVKIAMDLAGPKIRTGKIAPGPRVRKCKPVRDEKGHIIHPAVVYLVKNVAEDAPSETFPVAQEVLDHLQVGDRLQVTDTRDKPRRLKVVAVAPEEIQLHAYETCYLATDMDVHTDRPDFPTFKLGEVSPLEQVLILREGDTLLIHKEPREGQPALINEDGVVEREAHVSCQLPEVFDKVEIDEVILFDDGKIAGQIVEKEEDTFRVKIIRAKFNGSKLKAEKGINFPTTDLGISGLTEKDKEDLAFVVEHADVVNFSFVNSAADVEELLDEFRKHDALISSVSY